MKLRRMLLLGMVLQLSYWPLARAEPLTTAQTEINYLLDFIEISGCDFYRNGSWYDSVQAHSHLRGKYQYLSSRNRIETAEDFITQVASKSSLSGRPYQIRCGVGTTSTTSQWLHAVLARYRTVMARMPGPGAR